jgi:tetratricopeptide (TPR) repeat protein
VSSFKHSLHLLLAILLLCLPLEPYGSTQNSANTAQQSLQVLIEEQRAAIKADDPALVATASQKLVSATLQQLQNLSHISGSLTTLQTKQLEVQKKQLRQLLSSSLNDWGTAEARQQQYRQALEHFQQAEKWEPSTPGLMRNLGTAAFRVEDYSESIRALKVVVNNVPTDKNSRLMLAMSLFSIERFHEAAGQFAPIEELTMQDPRSAYAWAYSLAHTNQQQHANDIANNLAARELSPDIHLLVCKLYTALENYEHALPCLQKILEQYPSMLNVHYEIGATLVHMGRSGEAIPLLQAELTLNPDDVDAKYYLAYALLETSHREEAIMQLQSLISTDPQYSQAQYQLGKAMLEDNKTNEAVQHLEVAERLDPSSEYVHYQLQIAYRRAGRVEDANRELQVYKELKANRRNLAGHDSPQ